MLFRSGFVDLPLDMRGSIRLPSGENLYLYNSEALVIPNRYDQSTSRRTVAFYLDPSNIELRFIPENYSRV